MVKVQPGQSGNIDPTRRASTPAEAASTSQASRKARTAKTDTVELSDRARFLQQANSAVHNAADVREDKIAAVREKLENGTYEVDANLIAQRLLDHA